jgi:thymidylate synthase (FAD)
MKNLSPKVTLINSNGLIDAYIAARNCTSYESFKEMEDFATSNRDLTKLLKSVIIDNGHESIAEFIRFSFCIEGVNLATLGQYTRHRLQSLAVKSQRYITHKELVTSLPTYMENDERISDLFSRSIDLYNELVLDGVKPEDARLVLPQATTTTIVCTMNARELIHILEERLCACTQPQHRDVAIQMLECAKQDYGFIFNHVGPKCYRLGRCPEKRNNNGCQLFKKSPHYKG